MAAAKKITKKKAASKTRSGPAKKKSPCRSPVPFPIVGIGASAGGLQAFKEFLAAMPTDSGIALVLIQHLAPDHESMIVVPLSRYTKMPVQQAEDGMPVEPNHVYVIPPNRYLAISGNRLRLSEAVKQHGMRMSIDFFFRSLAEECKERAICIVLSGTGSDGSLGLRAVKGAGGMTMAQSPDSAGYDGMPRAAAKTELVDFILPAGLLPAALVRYVRHPYVAEGERSNLIDAAPEDHLKAILALLRVRTNHDFRCYKKGTLTRRIERRLGIKHLSSLSHYVDLLRSDEEEVHLLYRDLLIGVTAFFRDPEAWTFLETEVLPKLVASTGADDDPIRLWVAGCSSGEEAYSIAMLLFEQCAAVKKTFNAQIFATDIDESAIVQARAGRYTRSIAADVSAARLDQFFDEDGDDYVVKKHLRDSVVFAVQNLISDPPFSKLDVISCRNVLIYLDHSIQNKILQLFHFALKPAGYLFLGNSESTGRQRALYRALSKTYRIFARAGHSSRAAASFPMGPTEDRIPLKPAADFRSGPHDGVVEMARSELLKRFAPASVLINRSYDALYFHGATRNYLDYPTGEPTRDLTAICLLGLKNKLRGAVHRAATEQKLVSTVARKARRSGELVDVRISVEPLATKGLEEIFLVTFQDEHLAVPPPVSAKEISLDDADLVNQLENELQFTREDLQSSIEELETSNEELKASNEEVMSMNEELQSTNEEMETSREELQSLNEELTTVNTQLEEKIAELEAASNDVSNLLSSTNIATIFLDSEFKIRLFTPATRHLVHLIPSDLGRPMSDIALRFTDDALLGDARLVLEKLAPFEREVRDAGRRTYIRRITPYRTEDNHIQGVVITFTDITEIREKADLVRKRGLQQAVVAGLGHEALTGMPLDDLIEHACRETAEVFGLPFASVLKRVPDDGGLLLRAGVGWKAGLVGTATVRSGPHSQAGFTLLSRGPVIVENLAEEKRFKVCALLRDHGILSGISVLIGAGEHPWGIFGIHAAEARSFTVEDVHCVQAVANIISETAEWRRIEAHHIRVLDSISDAFIILDHAWRATFVNGPAERLLEKTREEVLDHVIWQVFPKFKDSVLHRAMQDAQEENRMVAIEEYFAAHHCWYEVRIFPTDAGDVSCYITNSTDRRESREQMRILNEELRTVVDERSEELRILNENVPAWFAFVDVDLRFRFINRFYEESLGLTLEECLGKPIRDIHPKETYQEMEPRLHAALRGEEQTFEIVLQLPREGLRTLRVRYLPRREKDDSISGIFVLGTDISEERRLQQEVLNAAEWEKARIGRDLHDSVCQELGGIGMFGQALSESLRRRQAEEAADALQLVDQINGVTHKARTLARGLSPVILENRTLAEALKELAENVSQLFKEVDCQLTNRLPKTDLDHSVATHLYLIAREATFNAVRHGRATAIELVLARDPRYLILAVCDNGVGKPSAIVDGLGIRSMRYRATTLGGSLSIRENPAGKGLEVCCRLPVKR